MLSLLSCPALLHNHTSWPCAKGLRDQASGSEFHALPLSHDWGGPVAFSLAAQHPEAVRRLAILDVAIPGDGADFSQGGRRWHHAFFRTLDLPEALCFGREKLILSWLFENYGYRPNCISEEDRAEYYRTYTKFGAFRAMLAYY